MVKMEAKWKLTGRERSPEKELTRDQKDENLYINNILNISFLVN